MARVVLEHICKTYAGGIAAVRDVSLTVEEGEFVVLVGPSGCGKSTLLRMVAGLEEITSGRLWIGDREVNDVPPKDRDVAMVFQNYALYPHMTVFENMAFGLRLRRQSRDEIRRRVGEAADILGISHLLDRRPRHLSGGQRQRVAVGRAMVRHPKVFLFDEPLSNLDAKMRVQMRAEIIRLHQRLGATMLYVTHDQVEAMTMGDRIMVLHDGVAQQVAPPMELHDHPANLFVAGFIGSPPMNLLRGRLARGADGLSFEAGVVRVPLTGEQARRLAPWADRDMVLGFRPEHGCLWQAPSGCLVPVDARLEAVERMGAEAHLHVQAGGHRLIIRAPGRIAMTPGQDLRIGLSPEQALFFDAESGAAVAGP